MSDEAKKEEYKVHKEKIQLLGKGAFSKVYLGKADVNIYENNEIKKKVVLVAIKEIQGNIDEETRQSISNEIEISRKLSNNSNIVRIIDISDIDGNQCIVYEYCNGGDLRKYIDYFETFDETLIQTIMMQLVNGLIELFKKNVVHHDIKPENILLNLCYDQEGKEKEKNIRKIEEILKNKKSNSQSTQNIVNNNYITGNNNFRQFPNFQNNNFNNNMMINIPNNFIMMNNMNVNNNAMQNFMNMNNNINNNINNNNMINMNPNNVMNMNQNNMINMNPNNVMNMNPNNMIAMNPNNMISMNPNNMISMNPNNMMNMNPNSMISMNPNNMISMNPNNMISMNPNNMINMNSNNMMNMNNNNMMNINNNNNFNQNLNNNAMNLGNMNPEININNYSFQVNIINNNNFANSNFNNNNMPNNQCPNAPNTLSSYNDKNNNNIFTIKKFSEILSDSTEYKLSDFGLSKLKSDIKKRNLCGSPLYMSPELFKLDSKLSEIENKAVDIWALGVLTYELFFGKRPFEAFSIDELSQMYEKGTYIMNLRRINEPEKKISKELFFFINKCLQKDPEKRANVYELRNGDFLNYDANSSDKMGEAVLRNFLKGIVEEDLKGNFILNINKDYEEEIKIRDLNKMWSNNN